MAILISKAQASGVELPEEVAFSWRSAFAPNVRELEGALRRIVANARFTGQPITLDFAKEALKDLLNLQARLVTIENIQKTVADYFKVRMGDLLSERRSRSVARPRQIAMALAKELTAHSLPEIGSAFGGATTPPCCMPASASRNCRKASRASARTTRICYGYLPARNLCTTLCAKLGIIQG